MTNLNKTYLKIVNPSYLITKVEDFSAWLDLAENKKDLEETLKIFEAEELYEHCALIRDKIESYK